MKRRKHKKDYKKKKELPWWAVWRIPESKITRRKLKNLREPCADGSAFKKHAPGSDRS